MRAQGTQNLTLSQIRRKNLLSVGPKSVSGCSRSVSFPYCILRYTDGPRSPVRDAKARGNSGRGNLGLDHPFVRQLGSGDGWEGGSLPRHGSRRFRTVRQISDHRGGHVEGNLFHWVSECSASREKIPVRFGHTVFTWGQNRCHGAGRFPKEAI